MEQACTHIMSASGACTKLSKRLKLGGLETSSFRNGKAKTRRSLYGVCWAGSGLSAFAIRLIDICNLIWPERLAVTPNILDIQFSE